MSFSLFVVGFFRGRFLDDLGGGFWEGPAAGGESAYMLNLQYMSPVLSRSATPTGCGESTTPAATTGRAQKDDHPPSRTSKVCVVGHGACTWCLHTHCVPSWKGFSGFIKHYNIVTRIITYSLRPQVGWISVFYEIFQHRPLE